jgi:hypothetical protein
MVCTGQHLVQPGVNRLDWSVPTGWNCPGASARTTSQRVADPGAAAGDRPDRRRGHESPFARRPGPGGLSRPGPPAERRRAADAGRALPWAPRGSASRSRPGCCPASRHGRCPSSPGRGFPSGGPVPRSGVQPGQPVHAVPSTVRPSWGQPGSPVVPLQPGELGDAARRGSTRGAGNRSGPAGTKGMPIHKGGRVGHGAGAGSPVLFRPPGRNSG